MNERVKMILAVVGILLLIAAYPIAYRSSATEVEVTVTRLERITEHQSGKYLAFAGDETFEITDSWLFGRFDASDLYGTMSEGGRYQVKVAGWRIGFLSMYRNILEATEVR